jgi:hypothetical protein
VCAELNRSLGRNVRRYFAQGVITRMELEFYTMIQGSEVSHISSTEVLLILVNPQVRLHLRLISANVQGIRMGMGVHKLEVIAMKRV